MSLTKPQQAEFRPLVKHAWIEQCTDTGTAPNNKAAYECWYREQIWTACRIRSTKDATEADYRTLIERFTLLSEGGESIRLKGLTEGQNGFLRSIVEQAWQAACRRRADGLQFNSWFDKNLAECGVSGRHVYDHVEQFDRIGAHFSVISGNPRLIDRFAEAAERRMRYLISMRMDELAKLQGRPVDWQYCRAIYQHMNLPLTMEEADVRWLWKVFQALDTHVRRLTESHEPACKV